MSYDPASNFTAISVQNTLMGAVFASSADDRLVVGGAGVNTQHGTEKGWPVGTEFHSLSGITVPGAMVVQRPLSASGSNGSWVFISKGLLPSLTTFPPTLQDEEWFCFHDTINATFGCMLLVGNKGQHQTVDAYGGKLILPETNIWSPVVIQLASGHEFSHKFDAFTAAVQRLPLFWDDQHFRFTSLLGTTVDMWPNSTRPVLINGSDPHTRVDYYSSPFIKGGGDSGAVRIQHSCAGEVTLNFTKDAPSPSPTPAPLVYIEFQGTFGLPLSEVNETGPLVKVMSQMEIGGVMLPVDVALQIADANNADWLFYRNRGYPRWADPSRQDDQTLGWLARSNQTTYMHPTHDDARATAVARWLRPPLVGCTRGATKCMSAIGPIRRLSTVQCQAVCDNKYACLGYTCGSGGGTDANCTLLGQARDIHSESFYLRIRSAGR
jgi:hypothetical protein